MSKNDARATVYTFSRSNFVRHFRDNLVMIINRASPDKSKSEKQQKLRMIIHENLELKFSLNYDTSNLHIFHHSRIVALRIEDILPKVIIYYLKPVRYPVFVPVQTGKIH